MFSLPPDSLPLPVFTNAPVQDERGPYQIPVEFKDEHNDTDFTDLVSSPSEDCLESARARYRQIKRVFAADKLSVCIGAE